MNNTKKNLYIGIMSGTSLDGADLALVDFGDDSPKLIAHTHTPYPLALRQEILSLCEPGENEIERSGQLDIKLGKVFANAVKKLLDKTKLSAKHIKAIGSHGQTIRHTPHQSHTCQIADPNTIAAETNITTIADFRRKDLALGGQGAPLVPAFHFYLLQNKPSSLSDRVIVNIGGIANITVLPKHNPEEIIGYDTGPGNTLLDAWIMKNQGLNYDQRGQWAAQGEIHQGLLETLLADPYFTQAYPKSTGREYFNLKWLEPKIIAAQSHPHAIITPTSVQRTLLQLTALTIMKAIQRHTSEAEILICGGGALNTFLMNQLQLLAGKNYLVDTSLKIGLQPQLIEPMAFAWLAYRTFNRLSGNLPSVTGASKKTILGAIYYP